MPLPGIALVALASPRRREILRLVWHAEQTAGAIHAAMPDVTFGAVSLQLKTLEKAGLVACRSEHRFRYYRVNRDALGSVATSLEHMWGDALWHLKLAAELEESRRGPRPGLRPRRRRTGVARGADRNETERSHAAQDNRPEQRIEKQKGRRTR